MMISKMTDQKARKSNSRPTRRKTRKPSNRIQKLDAIDFLHSQTLLSTKVVDQNTMSPPPGCVDYQFTALSALSAQTVPIHTELPPAANDTSYALQILLNLYRQQLVTMVEHMKSNSFRNQMDSLINIEKRKNQELLAQCEQLHKQIAILREDSLGLLKSRVNEIGIGEVSNTNELIEKTKTITLRNQELNTEISYLQNDISKLENENEQLSLNERHLKDEESFMQFNHLHEAIPPASTSFSDLRTPAQKKFAGFSSAEDNNTNCDVGKIQHYHQLNGHEIRHRHHKSKKMKKRRRHSRRDDSLEESRNRRKIPADSCDLPPQENPASSSFSSPYACLPNCPEILASRTQSLGSLRKHFSEDCTVTALKTPVDNSKYSSPKLLREKSDTKHSSRTSEYSSSPDIYAADFTNRAISPFHKLLSNQYEFSFKRETESLSHSPKIVLQTENTRPLLNHDSDTKWSDVSAGFDRMFELVSMHLENDDNVTAKVPQQQKLAKDKNKSRKRHHHHHHHHHHRRRHHNHYRKLSPEYSNNPPPLHRADSPLLLNNDFCNESSAEKSTSVTSSDRLFSPAPLEGPFSPVPALSPLKREIKPKDDIDCKKNYFNGHRETKLKDGEPR